MSSWGRKLGIVGTGQVAPVESEQSASHGEKAAERDGSDDAARARAQLLSGGGSDGGKAARTERGAKSAQVKGILRTGARHHAKGSRVKWRTVLVGDDAAAQGARRRLEAEISARERAARMRKYAKIARLPVLTYENLLIPLRLALPSITLAQPAIIALDVLTDLFELGWVLNELAQARRDGAGRAKSEAEVLDGKPQVIPYTIAHGFRDLVIIASLHCGRVLALVFHEVVLFQLLQGFRILRVRELINYVEQINNDLSTNVSFLAVYKFTLVLVSVPHWAACVWWALADKWAADPLELPHWNAQFALLTHNPELDLHSPIATGWHNYLMGLYMAWAGMTALGYGTLVITVQSEIIFAIVVALVQIVFYAFVLGTLFHYLVRTDEATVHAKQLLKAVDDYVIERRLPTELGARIRSHYEFQHRKSATATERIFSQMPLSLKTEVAVEQYAGELSATSLFVGCTPQFLNQLALYLRERYMMPKEILFKRGDGSTELPWCIGGSLHVRKGDVHISTVRSDIGPGQVVGEVAFVAGVPQPYTVLATPTGEVTLAVLSSSAFDDLITSYPEHADRITQNLLRRYGLDRSGNDLAGGPVGIDLNALSEDELKEHEALREMIRAAVVERNEEQLSQMLLAVWQGDTETVRTLVARGFDLDQGTYDQRTTLHLAAIQGNLTVVRLLCELGADANVIDRFGQSPIQNAVEKRHPAVADELSKTGSVLQLERPAERMLTAAKKGDVAHLGMLVAHGVEINAANYDRRTALHAAAADGSTRVVEFLLANLADVNAEDRWGRTPLDEAIEHEHVLVSRQIARNSPKLDEAAMGERLRAAAAAGDADKLRFLIDMGAPIDDADFDKRTALHAAVQAGSISTAYLLVSAMADVNLADRWGRPPLIDALECHPEIASVLALHCGAKLPPESALVGGATAGARTYAQYEALLGAAKAESVDMYALNRKINERARTRKADHDGMLRKTLEVETSLGKLSRRMAELSKHQHALFRTLGRHADIWINEYGIEDEEDGDTDSDPSDADSSSADDSGPDDDGSFNAAPWRAADRRSRATAEAAAAAAPADVVSSDKARFIKLVLQLPKAEAGLSMLRAAFDKKLSPSERAHLPSAARRFDEHSALGSILLSDLALSAAEADEVLTEIYAELHNFIGVSAPSSGAASSIALGGALGAAELQGLAELDEADEMEAIAGRRASARGQQPALPEMMVLGVPKVEAGRGGHTQAGSARAAIQRRGSGLSLLELSKHLHAVDEAKSRGLAASALAQQYDERSAAALGAPLGGGPDLIRQGAAAGSDDGSVEPVFLSDLGHVVLFCSKRLLEILAARHSANGPISWGAGQLSDDAEASHAKRRARASAGAALARVSQTLSSRGGRISFTADGRPSRTSRASNPLADGTEQDGGSPVPASRLSESNRGAQAGAAQYQSPSQWSTRSAPGSGPLHVSTTSATTPEPSPPSSPTRRGGVRESESQHADSQGDSDSGRAARGGASASSALSLSEALGEAVFVITSLFKVFDRKQRGTIRLRDVRELQGSLGEMGSAEIRSFVSHLLEASRAFAPSAQDRQFGSPAGRRRGSPQARRRGDGRESAGAGSSELNDGPLGADTAGEHVAERPPAVADTARRANVAPAPPASADAPAEAGDDVASNVGGAESEGPMFVDNAAAERPSAVSAAPAAAPLPLASGSLGLPAGAEQYRRKSGVKPGTLGLQVAWDDDVAAPPAAAPAAAAAGGARDSRAWRRSGARESLADRMSGANERTSWAEAADAPRKGLKQMTEVQFFVGVTSWILLSSEADGGGGSDDGGSEAGVGNGGSGASPELRLALGGARKPAPGAAAAHAGSDADAAQLSASGIQAAADAARVAEAVRSALVSAAAYSAIGDAIHQRLDTRRLRATDEVRASALLALIETVVVLPPGARAAHVRAWASDYLGLEIDGARRAGAGLAGAGGDGGKAAAAAAAAAMSLVEDEDDRVTWQRLASALGQAAAELRQQKGARGGASADGTDRGAAGMLVSLGLGGGGDGAATAREIGEKPWYIVSIRSAFYAACHRWFLFQVVFDFLIIPLQLSFIEQTVHMHWLTDINLGFDVVYILRVLLMFHVTHVNERSREVFDPREIRRHYLNTDFALDAFASWPHDVFALLLGAEHAVVIGLRIVRLAQLKHVWKAYKRWDASVSDDDLRAGLLKFISVLLVTMHLCSCVWNVFGYSELAHSFTALTWSDEYAVQNKAVGGYAAQYASHEAEMFDHYIVSFFFVVSMMTTLGAAQLPANYGEFVFYVFMMVLNMTVYAWTVGGISGVVMKQDDEVVAKRAKLELANSYIQHIDVPAELKVRLRKYFITRLQSASLSNVTNEEIYAGLPSALQMEVAAHTNRALVGGASLLRGCSDGFLNRLSSMLLEREIEAETVIFRVAEACKELLFVAHGTVEAYGDAEEEGGALNDAADAFEEIGPGETVGDVQFVFGIRYITNARVSKGGHALVFSLTRERYRELLKLFPSQEDVVMDNAMRQYEGVATARSARSAMSGRRSSISSAAGDGASESGRSGGSAPSVFSGSHSGRSSSGRSALSADSDARSDVTSIKDEDMRSVQNIVTIAKRKRRELYHSRLCSACAKGDLEKVSRLLHQAQADVDYADFDGRTALHLAACGGNARVVELLLAAKASANVEDRRGATPLADALACEHGAAAELLARHGGTHGSRSQAEALLCAAHAEDGLPTLRRLAQFGGDVSAQNAEQRTALHLAAAVGHAPAVRLLLEHKAEVNAADRSGATPLRDAMMARQDATGALLLERGARLGEFDAARHLCRAAAANDVSHLERLIRFRCSVNAADAHGRTALHLAASCQHVNACNFLISVPEISINAEDRFGRTPLDDAAREEAGAAPVLQTLLASRGGHPGSGRAHRSDEQLAAAAIDVESSRLERAAAAIRAREALLRKIRTADTWVRTEASAVARLKATVDHALRLEREKGAVLADELPELWGALFDYAEAHYGWHAHAVRAVQPALSTWATDAADFAAKGVASVQKRLSDLLREHDEGARVVERLYEVTFRKPVAAVSDIELKLVAAAAKRDDTAGAE